MQYIRNGERRIALAVVAMVAGLGGALVGSAREADAQRFTYCGINLSSGSWCGNNSVNHSYDGQFIESPGSNRTCERMLFDSNPSMVRVPGPTCASTVKHLYCYTLRGETDFQFQAEATQRSGVTRALTGNAYYGTLNPHVCPG